MTITFDISGILALADVPTEVALYRIFFWYFGWLPVAIVVLKGFLQIWLHEKREHYEHHQKFVLLAIDVPRNNQQSLLAVENMLTYFAGAHGSVNLIEKWLEGKVQLNLALEIVSIGGYIQFLIHTPVRFRDLVETAIYSQYPDAEIYEVEDYTKQAPKRFPDPEYDMWGTEFIQVKHEILPIRTYPAFEHEFGEDNTKFRDPMTSLMDLMSSLRKGEQLWYQIMLVPINTDWSEHALHFIDEKMGKSHGSKSLVDRIVKGMTAFSEAVYELWGHIEEHEEKPQILKFNEMDPMTKAQIEAAHHKMSKMGFEVCIRMIYLSRKEIMNRRKVANGFVGYIKQFNTNDLNSLKPDSKMTMTSAHYFFRKYRKLRRRNRLIYAYRVRSDMKGRKPWIMNVEEIATLWHFPLDAITKAPLIQRASGKRIEPPMSLPIDTERQTLSKVDPIFDDNYKLLDEEDEAAEKPGALAEHVEAPKVKEPAFFDTFEEEDSMVTSTNEAEIDEANQPAEENNPATVVESKTQPFEETIPEPATKKRGEAPDNLPFA